MFTPVPPPPSSSHFMLNALSAATLPVDLFLRKFDMKVLQICPPHPSDVATLPWESEKIPDVFGTQCRMIFVGIT